MGCSDRVQSGNWPFLAKRPGKQREGLCRPRSQPSKAWDPGDSKGHITTKQGDSSTETAEVKMPFPLPGLQVICTQPTFQSSGLGGDLSGHLQPFQPPRTIQKHDHLSAGLKHADATFFHLKGFALSPHLYQQGMKCTKTTLQESITVLRGHKSNFFQPQCTWFCLDSPHLCRLSQSSSWGTLTHPPKPNANVPQLQEAFPDTRVAGMVIPSCSHVSQDTLLFKCLTQCIRMLHIRVLQSLVTSCALWIFGTSTLGSSSTSVLRHCPVCLGGWRQSCLSLRTTDFNLGHWLQAELSRTGAECVCKTSRSQDWLYLPTSTGQMMR